MKRLCAFLLLLCLLPTLSACSYDSLERQAYPICISVDLKEGRYRLGIQAPQSSAQEGGASYDVLTATGDTLDDAIRVLSAANPYPLNFSQVRLCLIGYELAATTHLRPLLRTLFELPSMRPDAYVMVAIGDAAEVMAAQKPDLGMRLSTHLNLLFEHLRQEQLLPYSSLSACVQEIGGDMADPLMCICAINPSLQPKKQEQSGGQSGSGGGGGGSGGSGGGGAAQTFAQRENNASGLLPEDIIAGMLPQTSMNPVEYLGSAAVSDGRVSGLLTARETQLVTRTMMECRRAVAMEGEGMQLQLLMPKASPLENDRKEIRRVVEKLQGLDCDAFGFGWTAATSFYTDAQWEGYAFRKRFRTAEVAVVFQ